MKTWVIQVEAFQKNHFRFLKGWRKNLQDAKRCVIYFALAMVAFPPSFCWWHLILQAEKGSQEPDENLNVSTGRSAGRERSCHGALRPGWNSSPGFNGGGTWLASVPGIVPAEVPSRWMEELYKNASICMSACEWASPFIHCHIDPNRRYKDCMDRGCFFFNAELWWCTGIPWLSKKIIMPGRLD